MYVHIYMYTIKAIDCSFFLSFLFLSLCSVVLYAHVHTCCVHSMVILSSYIRMHIHCQHVQTGHVPRANVNPAHLKFEGHYKDSENETWCKLEEVNTGPIQ